MHQYLAVTANGLENLLVDELKELGVSNPEPIQAGVKFKASNELIYRCCLWSRLASRFVKVLSEFRCEDDMDLYLSVSAVNWTQQFAANKKFVVDFNGTNREIRNSQYGAMKVKDGIVDSFEKQGHKRPSIDKDHPDLRVHVRLHKEQALLGIDMVGSGLHQRGYRTRAGQAPLRETLAAAILIRSGWKPGEPLLDPMCGSGTIVIEAAMMSANCAPGVNRKSWSFENLNDFERDIWTEIKSEASVKAKRGINKAEANLFGIELEPKVLAVAKENAQRAGVQDLISFCKADATISSRPQGFDKGFIVSNPPYGERLGTHPGLIALYTAFGGNLKHNFPGCHVSLLSSSEELLSCLRMRADKTYKVSNGALRCHQKNYLVSDRARDVAETQIKEGGNSSTQSIIAPDFANRLKKNIQKIGKWAKKEQLDCYRVYDADLPDYNVAIDIYPDHLVIQEYAAPKKIAPEKAKRRLTDVIRAAIQVTGIDANNVILKVREKQKGKQQYQKLSQQADHLEVNEYGVKLIVNLTDYLDTGLFLDHKLTRKMLGELAKGKSFLNLFAYTGSATVHAACGGAKNTTTVDMSNTYLAWAKENMALNGQIGRQHQFEQADCLQWLKDCDRTFDLIFIDPPTFSNSKRMQATFDVQRDHVELLIDLKRILAQDGTLIFSNNKRHFKMDIEALKALGLDAQNISSKTLPQDFKRNQHIHNCWRITHSKG